MLPKTQGYINQIQNDQSTLDSSPNEKMLDENRIENNLSKKTSSLTPLKQKKNLYNTPLINAVSNISDEKISFLQNNSINMQGNATIESIKKKIKYGKYFFFRL